MCRLARRRLKSRHQNKVTSVVLLRPWTTSSGLGRCVPTSNDESTTPRAERSQRHAGKINYFVRSVLCGSKHSNTKRGSRGDREEVCRCVPIRTQLQTVPPYLSTRPTRPFSLNSRQYTRTMTLLSQKSIAHMPIVHSRPLCEPIRLYSDRKP